MLCPAPEAATAHRRVLVGWPFPDQAHERRSDPSNGRRAHHAARSLGDAPEDLAQSVLSAVSTGEVVAPEDVVMTLGIRSLGHHD
jgi:hypothetical protein